VTNRTELAPLIAEARSSLVSTLRSLRPEDWETRSLCSEWAVRDVAGHLVHLYDLNRAPYRLAALARHGLRVNRFLSEEARRLAKGRQSADLISSVEAAEFEQTRVWKRYPYPVYALSEFVVHAQDIRRPLGRTDKPTTRQLEVVADVFARPPRTNLLSRVFIKKLPPARLEATDADWTFGEGSVVRGPLEAIVMVLAGRGEALKDLAGEGVDRLHEVLS
jgi:uncharacterized protein (TIGR03083 family)